MDSSCFESKIQVSGGGVWDAFLPHLVSSEHHLPVCLLSVADFMMKTRVQPKNVSPWSSLCQLSSNVSKSLPFIGRYFVSSTGFEFNKDFAFSLFLRFNQTSSTNDADILFFQWKESIRPIIIIPRFPVFIRMGSKHFNVPRCCSVKSEGDSTLSKRYENNE